MTVKALGKIISAVIRKGGTGKTATVYNTAAVLVRKGFRVLVIDFDGQGSLSQKYGVDRNDREKKSIADMLLSFINGDEIDYEDYIHHTDQGVDLIHSNNRLDAFINTLAMQTEREYVLRDAIEGLREQYDYILIDNAPALNTLTTNSYVASDEILMVVTPEKEAISNISDSVEIYMAARKRANPSLTFCGILFNLVDGSVTVNNRKWEQAIVDAFPTIPVFDTAIPKSTKVREGNDRGKPIVDYDSDNRVARAYESFVEEFLELEAAK